ncbi:hypothetical protein WJ03_22940 [Burkholderia vietnamiensis]|nr:hypothetical protein WI94_04210 [Burkholderia vietnamiensis]KVE88479.1 hypothetical protein WJ00_08075 [Burkholderia vietnamiensis]KVE94930.1 hypothetical protein WJ03_22940 [Burkholderia vietnamiensis]
MLQGELGLIEVRGSLGAILLEPIQASIRGIMPPEIVVHIPDVHAAPSDTQSLSLVIRTLCRGSDSKAGSFQRMDDAQCERIRRVARIV